MQTLQPGDRVTVAAPYQDRPAEVINAAGQIMRVLKGGRLVVLLDASGQSIDFDPSELARERGAA